MPTKRQSAIVAALPGKCGNLLDVGCDHGLIGATALARGIAERVVFIDISEKCLEKARNTCAALDMDARAEFICQSGIGNLRCDCAVIAGMGGRQISEILATARYLPESLVLQPMKNVPELRAKLCENYTFISDEITECGGKFYDIIVLRHGGDNLSEAELLLGRTNLDAPSADFLQYLLMIQQKLLAILAKKPQNTQALYKLGIVRSALLNNEKPS